RVLKSSWQNRNFSSPAALISCFFCYLLLLWTIFDLAEVCLSSLKFPYEGGFLNYGKRIGQFGQNSTKEYVFILLFQYFKRYAALLNNSIWR
ncbi:MAG: hypothetical protein Q7W05_05045, partial [Deltaproteobacteria bacterium]|nr:hypothetical protein [Deltaproteobacteria bacterium]